MMLKPLATRPDDDEMTLEEPVDYSNFVGANTSGQLPD